MKTKSKRFPNRPMPEAIDGKSWSVRQISGNAGGATDPFNRVMMLPTNNASTDFVRLHELGHVKFTPPFDIPRMAIKYKCDPSDIQACEDMRIHSLMTYGDLKGRPARLIDNVSPDTPQAYIQIGENISKLEDIEVIERLAQLHVRHKVAIAERYANHRLRTVPGLSDCYNYITNEVIQNHKNGRLLVDMTQTIATQVAACMAGPRKRGRPRIQGLKATLESAQLLRQLIKQAQDLLIQDYDDKEMVEKAANARKDNGKWGKLLSIDKADLSITHKPKNLPIKVTRHVPLGARLGHIRRLLTDGRAFKRVTKKPLEGGTVLIDASGSMSLSARDLANFLDQAPSATIAMYSGSYGSLPSENHGRITIIGQKCRIATSKTIEEICDKVGPGNVIDGPALDWLSKQPGPRIWICDGVVTGHGDHIYSNLCVEALQTTRKHNITRFPSIDDYLEYAKAK